MPVVPVTRAPSHDEAKEQALRIQAEYLEASRNPTTEPRQRLVRPRREKSSAPVDERQKLREHILAMSLFPNLYNKAFLLRAQGSP